MQQFFNQVQWKAIAVVMCLPLFLFLISLSLAGRYAISGNGGTAYVLDTWTGTVRWCEPGTKVLCIKEASAITSE